MTPKEKQYYSEILYIDYMSSEESDYEEQEDFITGEKEKKLARYVTKKLLWERTSVTNAKVRLDRTYKNNLTPHAKAMAKPRSVGGMSERPAPAGPLWAVRQINNESWLKKYLTLFLLFIHLFIMYLMANWSNCFVKTNYCHLDHRDSFFQVLLNLLTYDGENLFLLGINKLGMCDILITNRQ